MDKPIAQQTLKKKRIRTAFRFGLFVFLLIAGWRLTTLALAPKIEMRDLVVASVEQGDVMQTLTASGTVVPAFEYTINAPVVSEIKHIRQERIRLEGQGQFLEELIASSHVGVIITDIDGRVTEVNPAAATFLNTTPEAMWGQVISAYRLDGDSRGNTLTINNRRLKWSQSKVRYKGFYRQFVVLEDLTAELLQSEKEAYGRVIRMMSHEVNNSTGAVNSILQTLGDVAVLEQMDESFIEAIAVARERNQNLGRFVANFASVIRVYQPQKQPVALVELAEKTTKLVQFEAAQRRIVCEVVNHAPAHATVLIDPIQIEQVLNNVVKNAMESIGEDGRIILTIAASGRGFEVADTGAGISYETSRLVQEALFYSSKSNGQGIGLMLTREILRLHDTHFTLATDGEGITRFRVDF
jgi:signal transduction histidine kinase